MLPKRRVANFLQKQTKKTKGDTKDMSQKWTTEVGAEICGQKNWDGGLFKPQTGGEFMAARERKERKDSNGNANCGVAADRKF
jgi:hypothetical protein